MSRTREELESLFGRKEMKAVDELCQKLELNEIQVFVQALRLYQLVQQGLDQNRFTSQQLEALISPKFSKLKERKE